MRIEFTPTPDDYKKIFRVYYLSNSRLWVILGVFGLPQLCCSVYVISQNVLQNNILPIIILLLLPAFLLYLLVLLPASFAQRVRNDPRLRSKTTWIVSEQQITIKNEFSESKIDWETFQRVIESRAYYLLFYQGKKLLFQMLPKRAFFSVDQELAFQKLLQKKVPKYRVLYYW